MRGGRPRAVASPPPSDVDGEPSRGRGGGGGRADGDGARGGDRGVRGAAVAAARRRRHALVPGDGRALAGRVAHHPARGRPGQPPAELAHDRRVREGLRRRPGGLPRALGAGKPRGAGLRRHRGVRHRVVRHGGVRHGGVRRRARRAVERPCAPDARRRTGPGRSAGPPTACSRRGPGGRSRRRGRGARRRGDLVGGPRRPVDRRVGGRPDVAHRLPGAAGEPGARPAAQRR
nr:hypothetical protein [Angustibacter aerolatus]